jgi:excisionase family DNA binding protein
LRTYMNTYHVAKSLGVNVQTVRHYIRQGELRAARVGKRYVVTQEDIDNFLERRKEKKSVEHIGLTDKGQETMRKIKDDADRILTYLRECPGAVASEITKALNLEVKDAQRALRRLEVKDLAHCEPGGEKLDRNVDPWYAGSKREE